MFEGDIKHMEDESSTYFDLLLIILDSNYSKGEENSPKSRLNILEAPLDFPTRLSKCHISYLETGRCEFTS
jgi:hypothetical protein